MSVRFSKFYAFYMMLQGMAQHRGKQTGTTAAPDLDVVLDLLSASYMYLPLALAYSPWGEINNY